MSDKPVDPIKQAKLAQALAKAQRERLALEKQRLELDRLRNPAKQTVGGTEVSTQAALAKATGYSAGSISKLKRKSWFPKGPPWIVEEVLAALAEHHATPQSVSAAAGVARATPAGRKEAREQERERQTFAEEIGEAHTDEERERLLHKLAVLSARGVYSAQEASAIRQALAEARRAGAEKRKSASPDEAEVLVPVSEDGVRLVEAWEGIVSDERRAELLELVLEAARLDAVENPNVDRNAIEAEDG